MSAGRAVVCGLFGAANLGDDAVLLGVLKLVRESGLEPLVLGQNPGLITRTTGVPAIDPVHGDLDSALRSARLFVLGGGGLLFDFTPGNLAYWLGLASEAMARKVPVAVLAVGAGPIAHRGSRTLTRDVLRHAAVVSVRDRRSLEVLRECGLHGVIEVPDPAFLVEDGRLGQRRPGPPRMTLALRPVFHRSEWWPGAARRYRQLVEALAEVLVGVAGNPGVGMDLLAFQEPDDREFARAVLARAGLPSDAARLYEGPLDPVTARTLLQESELVVAMRLHAVILGAGVPMVGVAYDAKVEGALESLGLAGWSVPVGDGRLGADSALDAPALLALVRSAWRTRSQLRRKLEPAAREIRAHAQRGGRAVLARALGAAGPDMASELPRPWPLERAWRHRGSGPAPATSHVAADTQGGSGRATPAAQNYPDRLHALARLACAAGDADAALALWPNLLPALALRAGNLLAAEPTRDNDVESARALLSLAAADADMALHLLASVPATRAAGLTQALAAKPTGCDPEAQTRRAAGLLMHLVGGREVAAQRLEAMGRVHDARRIRLLQQLVQQSGGGAIVRLQRVRDRLHAIHEGLITRRGWAAIVRAACSNPDVTEELERDVLLLGRELLAGPPQPVAQEPAPSGAR